MLSNVNIEQVKEYNKSLKEYRDKAAKVQAGIEYSEKELARICAELTSALGVTVTPENIEQVRDEYITRINSVLATGTDIINRIRSEEAMIKEVTNNPVTSATPVNSVGAGVVTPQAPVGAPQAPQAPVGAPQAPQAPQAPVGAPQAPQGDTFANLGEIPPIFGKI